MSFSLIPVSNKLSLATLLSSRYIPIKFMHASSSILESSDTSKVGNFSYIDPPLFHLITWGATVINWNL